MRESTEFPYGLSISLAAIRSIWSSMSACLSRRFSTVQTQTQQRIERTTRRIKRMKKKPDTLKNPPPSGIETVTDVIHAEWFG